LATSITPDLTGSDFVGPDLLCPVLLDPDLPGTTLLGFAGSSMIRLPLVGSGILVNVLFFDGTDLLEGFALDGACKRAGFFSGDFFIAIAALAGFFTDDLATV
jgi:hypothetical protein